jgi:hypothetical protein
MTPRHKLFSFPRNGRCKRSISFPVIVVENSFPHLEFFLLKGHGGQVAVALPTNATLQICVEELLSGLFTDEVPNDII